ncbi:Uncharacterized protein APZ42_024892 [Daphnia magna]|uniref:Uncharacterized protein n=1 Tax=Daphnia magna TaxID=35525 RepID=A0A164TN54_9CRUS|nr:Uncharacterized protein APZ42_024892 [Daphnia magna]
MDSLSAYPAEKKKIECNTALVLYRFFGPCWGFAFISVPSLSVRIIPARTDR